MYWSDKVVQKIIDSGKFKPYWVDDMFTPSGYAHIGSLRGPIIHDLIYKSLGDAKVDATYTYVINDFDPIDGLPGDLKEEFSKYLGYPLRNAPSPVEEFKTFADYFANDYMRVLNALGVNPKLLSSYDMYHEGKFNDAIRLSLDNSEVIQDIYSEISGSKKKESGWLPLQVVCENCNKLGTTRVFDWDGKTVAYKCEPNMVSWAKGCDHEARVSPFDGNGKLPWKVDWPAHWMVLGVTIEGAGKDHSVAGGSRDIAREICKKVFKIDEPFNLPYEFLTIGGKKMASSKGLGLKARDLFDLLPPEVGRFLYCRTDYRQEVDFNPSGTMAIPDLFDEYDRCFRAYINSSDEDLARAFELSQIKSLPQKSEIFLPRFRDVVNFAQQATTDLVEKFQEIKGKELLEEEVEILKEREKYAKIWIEKYAPDEFRLGMAKELPENAKSLTGDQRKYLGEVIKLLEDASDPDKLQIDLYNLAKELGFDIKSSFSSIYIVTIGKEYGPRAGAFLLQYPKEEIIGRLKEVSV
jgi:lysyl-tRNA synthetase, class I